MAENDLDSDLSTGTADQPTSPSSAGNGASNGSLDAAKLQSLIEGFGKRIEEIDARTRSLQGDKDRGVVKTKKEVEELKAKIAEYEKLKSKGLEPDEALDEMDFRSTVRQLQEQLSRLAPASTQPIGNGAGGASFQATARLQEYGLDPNSPEAIELQRSLSSLNKDAAEAKVERFILDKLKPQKPANIGDVVQSPSTTRTTETKLEVSDYKKEMLAAPRGPKGDAQRTAIKERYRKAGIPIDGVDFTQ